MKETLKISILGDICPDRKFNKFFLNTDKIDFGSVVSLLQDSDIVVGNLEAPATNNSKTINKTGPCLHCLYEDIAVLREIGIDYLSLANNHILDYGTDGLLETLEIARNNGITTFGAAVNSNEAKKPIIIKKKGWKIGFISFAEEEFSIATTTKPGANLFDPYTSLNDIKELKSLCDYVVVLYHGGIEHYELPSPLLQKKCRAMVEFGADLVLCQHSHCIGTFEKYNSGNILYGQGNSYFGKRNGNLKWNQGFLVNVILDENGNNLSFKLMEAKDSGIELCDDQTTMDRVRQMLELSKRLNDFDYINKKWISYCMTQEALDLPLMFGWSRVFNKLNRMSRNRLAKLFISKKNRMVTMNFIRCDSHNEVVKTILELTYE